MRRYAVRLLSWIPLCLGTAGLCAEFPDVMVPQPQVLFNQGASSTWNADWEGVNGRTYLMQWSEDLVNWNYFPLTESGAGTKSYGFASSTDKFFMRLECADETPDLARTSVWQPPLLLVGGQWTVLAKSRDGDPAPGVELAFYLWPANASKPQGSPLSKARTAADGTCAFDPSALGAGDRVEVRMTGSPNQRVYLPWQDGRETPDDDITPGGEGIARTGFVAGPGSGKIPDYQTSPAEGEEPDDGPDMPVYRLLDFMTSRWSEGHEEITYPLDFHLVIRETNWWSTPPVSDIEAFEDPGPNGAPCAVYWDRVNRMGWGIPDGDLYFDYDRTFSVDFDDPGLSIGVQRNVFVGNDYLGGGGCLLFGAVVPDAIYQPAALDFFDGVEVDLGSGALPMLDGEFPGDAEAVNRFLVLGPAPMYVPKEVLGGEPFYFRHLAESGTEGGMEAGGVRFFAELPLGTGDLSGFISPATGNRINKKPRVVWTVSHNGPARLGMKLETGSGLVFSTGSDNAKQLELVANENDYPCIVITFRNLTGQEDIHADFELTVKAAIEIPNPLPGTDADGDGYPDGVDADGDGQLDWAYARSELGAFTTRFRYSPREKQAAELAGSTSGAPESDGLNGGQRFTTIESERRIGVTGDPSVASPTFVDALTGRFHHAESDFALAIPGSDLSLGVTRRVRDSIWTLAYGLSPAEDPLLVFGPGWDSNLCASVLRTTSLRPDGTEWKPDDFNPRMLKSRISVRDYQGRSLSFLEYQDGNGVVSLLPDPTLLPERENSGIALTPTAGGLSLHQPSTGTTHIYQKTAVDFKISNNRDEPRKVDASNPDGMSQPTGYTRYEYYRLTSVTDRFGVTLDYVYGTNPANLIPDSITVRDRPALQLRFKQSGGRVDAFWDPAGVRHGYSYEARNLAGTGQPASTHTILAAHRAGTRTAASYGYQYLIEADPRPQAMLLSTTSGQPYTIDTYHIVPSSIANGCGDTITVTHRASTTRLAWSKAALSYYHTAGDPAVVDHIQLPNQRETSFNLLHVLKNAAPGHAAQLSIKTLATTMRGDHWTYDFGTPQEYRWILPEDDHKFLPTAVALFFPTLTRACDEVADSGITFTYKPEAGFALGQTTDAAARSGSATYEEAFPAPGSLYQAPQVSPGVAVHSRFKLPTTTTDRFNHTTDYDYVENPGNPDHMLVASVTDFRDRVVIPTRGAHARTESIRLEKAGNVLAKVDLGYDATLPGAVNKITRKAIAGSGDPAWVADLVRDIHLDTNGFPAKIGNNAADLLTKVTRGPSGRVLSVTAPHGGVSSNQYDSSGLLESSFRADGGKSTYVRDPAGRVVFQRDAAGHATGIEIDPLGRVIKSVRDMNGNLGYTSGSGLAGVDAGTDIITSTLFLDASHEARHTDPRGFVSIRRYNALGWTTQLIEPGNTRAPGTLPDETNDRLTHVGYDLLQSPDSPVSVTDPLGYQTLYKFDSLARLEKILREYGADESGTPLFSGTAYSYDAVTGLPDRLARIRTPLDEDGDPVAGASLEQLVTRIIRDDLDRPQTTIFAEGTDKELRGREFHTSTGIRYRKEIRDTLADAAAPEHWSVWELTCDALGRPARRTLPATVDALTGQTATPFTDFIYDENGGLHQTGDSYGNLTTYGFDVNGALSWRKDPAVKDAKSGLVLEPVRTYGYDAAGLLVHEVDPLGYAWHYERDPAGRVTTSTGPVVNPAGPANRRRPVWVRSCDPSGNLLDVTDPEGRVRSHGYYPDNRTRSTTIPVTFTDEAGTPSLVDVVEQYIRDEKGRVLRVIDGGGQSTAFTYDGLNRTLSATRDPDDSRARTETTTYDALLPLSLEDAAGHLKEFRYDGQFRLSRIDVAGNAAESLGFGHDVLGNINHIAPLTPPADTSMGNPAVARVFDALGQLREETSNGVTTTYGYDLRGLMSHASNNANARVLSVQHDAAGRVSRVTDNHGATLETLFGHDLAGNLVREEMSNGLTCETGFDPLRRVTSRRVRNETDDLTLHRTGWQYDLLSNITRIEESSPQAGVPDRIIENTYNERGQLLTETRTRTGGSLGASIHTHAEIHRYDLAENRIATRIETLVDGVPSSSLTRAFDYGDPADGFNSNQLRALTETPGGGGPAVTSYQYDPNGNRTGRTLGAATDIYTYDAFNRLTGYQLNTATPAENGEWQYAYDPLTRRIARRAAGQTARQFAFSGGSPAHEWEGSPGNGTLIDHIGGGVGGRLYTQDAGGLAVWPLQNTRGDIVAEFSAAGAMTWQGSYDANGLLEAQTGPRGGNYGPNGKWEEPGGLVNDGFRHRDRHTGTFLSRDPAGFIDGPNTYNYVRHNPWSAWDPHGLSSYMVPTGTADIGYTGVPSVAGSVSPIGEPQLNGDSPTVGSGWYPIEDAEDVPSLFEKAVSEDADWVFSLMISGEWVDYEKYLSGIITAHLGSQPEEVVPYALEEWALTASSRELTAAAESGGYGPKTTRHLRDLSQRASDFGTDCEILTGTVDGCLWILSLIEPTPVGEYAMSGRTAVRMASADYRAANTGGRTWTHGYGQIGDDVAEAAYQAIRGSTTDVTAISRYTGYKPDRLGRIKDYLFNNKEWTGADGDIAAAWHRLRTGRGTDTDRLLLKHETAEMWFRRNVNDAYSPAHQRANQHWNWQQAVEGGH